MAVNSGYNDDGSFFLTFGTLGNNYWGQGVYDRSLSFNISNLPSLDLFNLAHVSMDDWLLIRVNGHVVFVGPHGGDRLNIVSRMSCQWDGEGGEWCYMNHQTIEYGPGLFSESWEFSRDWHFYPNINIRPFLVEGSNTITTRTIVGGRGESYIHFNTRTYGCPAGQTLSGNLCLSGVSIAATPSYFCPSGMLIGTQCSTTGAAAPAYSCPPPDTLNGTTCTHATTNAIPQPTMTVMDESTLNNCAEAEKYGR
jgi:hypothetical protein